MGKQGTTRERSVWQLVEKEIGEWVKTFKASVALCENTCAAYALAKRITLTIEVEFFALTFGRARFYDGEIRRRYLYYRRRFELTTTLIIKRRVL